MKVKCVLQNLATSINVLYAFVKGDDVLYIGKSVRSLRQRLYGYENPGPTQSTNIKANKLIREALGGQSSIAVYAFADPGDLRRGEFHLNLAAALEDNLIATLRPPWNKAGIGASQRVITKSKAKMPMKYEALELHLNALPKTVRELTISFAELELILGAPLPSSALAHRAWWGNQKDSKGRPQAHAWLSAGFMVDSVNQSRTNGSVRFKRQ